MKIFVKVKTRAKQASVEKTGDFEYSVSVQEPPAGNRANVAIISALSDFFDIPKSRITLASGKKSKQKFFELN